METIFDIELKYKAVFDELESLVDLESGEIVDPEQYDILKARLTEIEGDRDEKIRNTIRYYKSQDIYLKGLEAEAKRIADEKAKVKRTMERVKKLIEWETGGKPLKDPEFTVSYRRTKSVQILDIDQIPDVYMRSKTTIEPDKTSIKQAIQDGEIIPGAELVENTSITVK